MTLIKTLWDQSLVLTTANLKARYRNSVFGYLWVLLGPLSTYMAQAYVFKFIFRVPVENYLQFLLFGLLPWIFFSQTLEMVTTSFYHNGRLLKNVKVQPMALIVAQTVDNMINNFAALAILLTIIGIWDSVPWLKVYLFPIPYLVIGVTAIAFGFFLAALNVEFFDVKFVLNFALGLLFFLTPVIYPENFVPQEARFLLDYNPIHYLLRPFRALLETGPSALFWLQLRDASLVALAALVLAGYYWKRRRNEIYLKL